MTIATSPVRSYDYTALSPDVAESVQSHAAEIHQLAQTTVEATIEIGKHLIAVKDQLEHGQFGTWLDQEFHWSHRTANRMMNVARKFANLANLDTIAPSALALLAEPGTPDDVVEALVERAQTGEEVTYTDAQKAVWATKEPHPDLLDTIRVFLAANTPPAGKITVTWLKRCGAYAQDLAPALAWMSAQGELDDRGDHYTLTPPPAVEVSAPELTDTQRTAASILELFAPGQRIHYKDLVKAANMEQTRYVKAINFLLGDRSLKQTGDGYYLRPDAPAVQPDTPAPAKDPDRVVAVMNGQEITAQAVAELQAKFDRAAITLAGETDDGAWHRAIGVARKLVVAGLWDGQRHIEFDAYALHDRLYGVSKVAPADLVEGEDYWFVDDAALTKITGDSSQLTQPAPEISADPPTLQKPSPSDAAPAIHAALLAALASGPKNMAALVAAGIAPPDIRSAVGPLMRAGRIHLDGDNQYTLTPETPPEPAVAPPTALFDVFMAIKRGTHDLASIARKTKHNPADVRAAADELTKRSDLVEVVDGVWQVAPAKQLPADPPKDQGSQDAAYAVFPRSKFEAALLDIEAATARACQVNGVSTWYALGPESLQATRDLIERAVNACTALTIHLSVIDGKLATMITTGQPYEEEEFND